MNRSQIDILIDGSNSLEEFIMVTISTFHAFKREGGYISSETFKDTMKVCMQWGALYQERKGGSNGVNKGTEAGSDTASSP